MSLAAVQSSAKTHLPTLDGITAFRNKGVKNKTKQQDIKPKRYLIDPLVRLGSMILRHVGRLLYEAPSKDYTHNQ